MIRSLLAASVLTGAALASTAASAQCISGTDTFDLTAGQHYDAGDVMLEVVGDTLEVTYTLNAGWTMTEAQLYVGSELPDSNAPGQFPYKAENLGDASTHTFEVPLSDLAFACYADDTAFVGLAHASVRYDEDGDGTFELSETAWAGSNDFPYSANWGTYFDFVLSCDCGGPEDPPDGCETAFAYSSTEDSACFLDNGFNRWGWSVGPVTEGTYTWDLYAGAAGCDLTAPVVGTVTVTYAGGTVMAEYAEDEGYIFLETQTYAGEGMFPTMKQGKKTVETVAPGQYTIGTDLYDGVYVIAHAVSCAE